MYTFGKWHQRLKFDNVMVRNCEKIILNRTVTINYSASISALLENNILRNEIYIMVKKNKILIFLLPCRF